MDADTYTNSTHHLLGELERIDLLIRLQVMRARELHTRDELFQGLYISEDEVDALLAQPAGLPRWALDPSPRTVPEVRDVIDRLSAHLARRTAVSLAAGVTLRLCELKRMFALDDLDVDLLLLAMAPETDLRYGLLYAYLQNDVTKKRLGVDLALNLLSASLADKLAGRERFAATAPLVRHQLIHLFDDPADHNPPLLGRLIKADERVANYLLDADELDHRLLPFASLVAGDADLSNLLIAPVTRQRLTWLVQSQSAASCSPFLLYLQGPAGAGKHSLAAAVCAALPSTMLVVDSERLLANDALPFATAVHLILREALLQRAVIYWQGFDLLLAEERLPWSTLLVRNLAMHPGLTILAGDAAWEPADLLPGLAFARVPLDVPSAAERAQMWLSSLNGGPHTVTDAELGELAAKFRLVPGQIRDAAATARNLARWRDPQHAAITLEDLHTASRLHSNRKLATLARKIKPGYHWDDIVLPTDRIQQLREICNQVRHRMLVHDTWGFDKKLSLGKGLNILFTGPSGTGKTMAAEIMAGEMGFDLYQIDLSSVVSKYIGETEKNLARIFEEAETSNAILFFDEADALFGKRSEVHDSHDRYANLEISYLLQRMEEYQGIVILATNLHKNMDEAFVRRMQFTIEFPFPAEKQRRRIWEKVWPAATPCAADLDLDFMARRFELAGGNIRNIALAAAFLAADDDKVLRMAHLIQATHREHQKMGKVTLESEYGEYARHVTH